MRILVVGSGGREHALCWAIAQDVPTSTLYCAPGNPGTESLATNINVAASDSPRLLAAAKRVRADLVVVGPEAPLADGLADLLRARGVLVFGPSRAAAQIEASKEFAKSLMDRAGIPTAAGTSVTSLAAAEAAIAVQAEPVVVKASGLAAGKGAFICPTRAEARAAARSMLVEGRFGEAGATVMIEEFMDGEELSVFAITDGEHVSLLPTAQDHKRIGEGDTGPNTGGMGAYTPVSIATPALLHRVRETILLPALSALAERDTPYRGVLYAGLMIRPDGSPAVIEFNCRFGDPEAQAVLSVGHRALVSRMVEAAQGRMTTADPFPAPTAAAVVTVLAAAGYPESPRKGDRIALEVPPSSDVLVFHAGTARRPDGGLATNGGRVMGVVGLGADIGAAAARSRAAAAQVSFAGKQYRRDIGWRELARAGVA